MSAEPDFHSHGFLMDHVASILAFYDPRVVDRSGGYFQNFRDNGEGFDPHFRQLVSSARIVVNYALCGRLLERADYLAIARHGLDYLENVHWRADLEAYAWTLRHHRPLDMTQRCYGYAFVLLAYAAARRAGLLVDNAPLRRMFELLEQRFWQAEHGLYADEISPAGELIGYRGQNANMHLCEAMLMAYEASSEEQFLDRANLLAEGIAGRQAAKTGGLIWEHYTTDFDIDWDHNRDDPKNLYQPWGFQAGHQTEWSKLLLMLHRHTSQAWLVERARELFDRTWPVAWDERCGGLVYGFDRRLRWCDDDKYFWVQAESFAAAAMLYRQTGEAAYRQAYDALWQYSWTHFVDHRHGAWFRILSRGNERSSDLKCVAGAKCDYHTLGACLEVLRSLPTSGANS